MTDSSPAQPDLWSDGRPLLRWGLGLLRRWSRNHRYAYLYPDGPNPKTVFDAFQSFSAKLMIQGPQQLSPRAMRRRFKKQLRRSFIQDAWDRDTRVRHKLPNARPSALDNELPPVIRSALQSVSEDARVNVASFLTDHGQSQTATDPEQSEPRLHAQRKLAVGLQEFREALTETLLEEPRTLLTIHPQYLYFTQPPLPWAVSDPWRSWLLVRLPLQVIFVFAIVFFSGYSWAYLRFNDEVLAEFLTDKIGSVIDGELVFGRIHWGPTLALDLAIGRAHTVDVQNVRVYEGFKYARREGGPAQGTSPEKRVTAYAEHLKAKLVLHEIIPWNRLGVPRVFNIPWYLHFTELKSLGEMWVGARSYFDQETQTQKVSLTDAFGPADDSPPTLGYRALSFRIDDTEFPKLTIPLDFLEDGEWASSLELHRARLRLRYDGDYPERAEENEDVPLKYLLHADGGKGRLVMLDEVFEINQIQEIELGAGYGEYPMGDMSTVLKAEVEHSDCELSGSLTDVFRDKSGVDTHILCSAPDGLFTTIMPVEPGDAGPILSGGTHGQVALEISGSLADPLMEFQAESIQLDGQLDPELRVKDVDLVASLRSQTIPDRFADVYTEDGVKREHWTVLFERFSGRLMTGKIRSPLSAQKARLILPGHAEPFAFSGAFELDGLKLDQGGSMVPSYYRHGQGGIQVERLVFGESRGASGPPPRLAPVTERFGDIWPEYQPTYGPAEWSPILDAPMTLQTLSVRVPSLELSDPSSGDGLPNQLLIDGSMRWDRTEGLTLSNTRVSTPGASVLTDLRLNAGLNRVNKGTLTLDIHDGARFFSSLGLPKIVEQLQSDLEFSGPLHRLSGPPGKLSTPRASIAGFQLGGLNKASLQWSRGALILDAPRLEVLGGQGPLRAELWPNLGSPKDPKIRASLSLRKLAQDKLLGWPVDFSNAQLDFVVDDGTGGPRSLNDFHARGHAYIPKLTMAKVRYHNARAAFVITPKQIELDELSLRYGRSLSPKLAPSLRVSTGFFAVKGSLGLSKDPALDLQVRSSGLPLRALTNFAGASVPVRGRIGQGSLVTLKGRVSQPQVEGSIHLASVNAANLPLGRGKLEFSSHRASQGRGSKRLDIREVRVKGRLKTPAQKQDGLRIDATFAVGRDRKGTEYRELAGKGSISTIPLKQLLALPHQDKWKKQIRGSLQDLSIEASYCPAAKTMLSECKERHRGTQSRDTKALKENALALSLRLERGWAGIREQKVSRRVDDKTRCPAFASTCLNTPLYARLNEGTLTLRTPLELLSGPARTRSKLTVQGSFDLRSPKEQSTARTCNDFLDRLRAPKSASGPAAGQTRGQVRGNIDLSGLDPAIVPLRWGPMRGQVNLNLDVHGPIAAPWVKGSISNQSAMLSWTLERTETEKQEPIELRLKDLDIDIRGEVATIQSQVSALRGKLDFRSGPRGVTGVGLTGACRGQYAIHMGPQSRLDARLLALLFPEEIKQADGSIGIPKFSMGGNWRVPFRAGAPAVDHLNAQLSMGGHNAEFSIADMDLRVPRGEIDVRLCEAGDPCAGKRGDEGLSIRIGSGSQNRLDSSRPMDALGFQSDSSGRTQYVWGHLTVPPELQSLRFAELSLALDQFPYRQDDNAGRPELVAHLSSENLRLRVTPDGFRRISGNLTADKARWLRDASQGVRSVVSFADPVPAPPSTLSQTLSSLELDLNLKTTSPFRVDNNILRGLEAQAEIHLGGSVGAMEVTGPIEVQQGVLDLALLGGAYVIDHGRVRLNRRIADSEVDISATRKAPVRIDNELHQVTLDLDGPLDAIRWRCHSTAQRNRGLQTLRGCIDYLIFDAGNAALTPQEEIDTGSLNLTRRSLTLFGNLTQVELNRFVEDELPRTGEFLPIVRGRVRQLGLELQIQTREDWFSWRWGRLGLGYSYLRGYSGSFLRASQSLSSQLHLLEDVALETQLGLRNYSNVALVLQPPRFGSVELGHRIRIPGFR